MLYLQVLPIIPFLPLSQGSFHPCFSLNPEITLKSPKHTHIKRLQPVSSMCRQGKQVNAHCVFYSNNMAAMSIKDQQVSIFMKYTTRYKARKVAKPVHKQFLSHPCIGMCNHACSHLTVLDIFSQLTLSLQQIKPRY